MTASSNVRSALPFMTPSTFREPGGLGCTQATAAHHGRLLAQVRRFGSPRGAHDLIIAAHAAETGRIILSRDAKARFGELPGVTAIDA
jgi:tRNA(fMet)-specific endonuclease VapC